MVFVSRERLLEPIDRNVKVSFYSAYDRAPIKVYVILLYEWQSSNTSLRLFTLSMTELQ